MVNQLGRAGDLNPPIATPGDLRPPLAGMSMSHYPFTSHFLDLAGVRLHYLDEGQGEPVVMLHGNPTWSFYYRGLVKALRPTNRVVVPDHIGCGLSDKPDDSRYSYTLARRVADLEALLDHLQLRDNLTLIVHDWGGMIGFAFAVRHPERIKRLIVLNTAAFHLPPGKQLPWSLWFCRKTPLGPLLIRGLNAFCRGAARYCSVQPLPAEVRAGYVAPYDSWRNRIAVERFVSDIPLTPADPSFQLVTEVQDGLARLRDLPMLICWGERDFVFDHDFFAEWRRRFPDAEVHTFPNAGHYVLEDAGAEIARLVFDFLAKHPLNERRGSPPPAARRDKPGGSLVNSSLINIAAHLPARAKERPDVPAIIEPHGRQLTFQELDADSDRIARGLEQIGICRGTRTVLMVPPSLDFYALTFALFKLGAVIILIDPGMGIKNLGRCLAEAMPEAFIGVTKAQAARILFGWGRATVRKCVTVGTRLGWSGPTLDQVRNLGTAEPFEMARPRADETAAILFTSGSTGIAKGVIYTHAIFNAQVELLRTTYGIEAGEMDLPTFPLFGLFGPVLGMTAVIPEMDFTRPAGVNPRKLIDTIQRFKVTNLFGSPAVIRRVGAFGATSRTRLPSLRRVISAGAPVPAKAIELFQSLLGDGVEVSTPYGATEALPVSSIGSREILGETSKRTAAGGGVCVGRPVDGMLVRIIRISDEPITSWSDDLAAPPGEIGEVVVQGPVVTRAYFNRPDSTALAKIADPAGGFWHRMGDVGYFDDLGRLWFCGRKSQRVLTENATLFTIPCEGVFNAHPAVFRTALVGVVRDHQTIPVLCVERDPAAGPMADEMLRSELLSLGEAYPHTKGIRTILFHPAFPVDIRHNAKIFREKLAVWAARRLR